MTCCYPCRIARARDTWLASFADVPEARTEGHTYAEAVDLASDALACALAGYVEERRELPRPGTPAPGEELVTVPALAAAKLVLYETMRHHGVTRAELARRLGVSVATVARIVSPDHRSHIDTVDRALRAVGLTLVVDARTLPAHAIDEEDQGTAHVRADPRRHLG